MRERLPNIGKAMALVFVIPLLAIAASFAVSGQYEKLHTEKVLLSAWRQGYNLDERRIRPYSWMCSDQQLGSSEFCTSARNVRLLEQGAKISLNLGVMLFAILFLGRFYAGEDRSKLARVLPPLTRLMLAGLSLSRHHTLIVRGDVGRLQQAVTNLLSNACKFSPRGSEVKVTGELRDGQIHIVVEDVGPGIPEQFREQIFRRFAQADAQHRSGVAGTGLGLAITKAIVEQHGGEIGYDSTLGVGTRFWVLLPEFLPNRLDF